MVSLFQVTFACSVFWVAKLWWEIFLEDETAAEYYRRTKHDRVSVLIHGFAVYAERGVLERQALLSGTLEEELGAELAELRQIVNTWGKDAQELVRNVKIIVNANMRPRENPEALAWHTPLLQPMLPQHEESVGWTRGAIVIPRASEYILTCYVRRSVNDVMLHELAHALHDAANVKRRERFLVLALGTLNADAVITSAYEEATAQRKYDGVHSDFGTLLLKPYGLTDKWEYFATSAQKFFSRVGHNEYPVTNSELKAFDRRAWNMVQAVTGVSDEDAQVFEKYARSGYVSSLRIRLYTWRTGDFLPRPYYELLFCGCGYYELLRTMPVAAWCFAWGRFLFVGFCAFCYCLYIAWRN